MTGSVRKASAYALRLLGYRSRSERELHDRLRDKGFSDEAVTSAISALRQAGLIDDRAFAENTTRQALQDKLLSHEGTRRLLSKKGVPKEIIDETLTYDEVNELENARKILSRKLRFKKDGMTFKDKSRLWNFLVRRGFPFHIADKALRLSSLEREDEV